MINNNSPLESLAAFAIAFAAGAVSAIGLGLYIGKLKQDAQRAGAADTVSPLHSR
ncbi:hypothetical protein AB4Z48_28355 [Cupriavidus sp. 2TAF22]|uniref:hypothetical protein n=1 Tax=unclassified Cupriavidus TaxID=2640874 RepID=UPI003F8E281E